MYDQRQGDPVTSPSTRNIFTRAPLDQGWLWLALASLLLAGDFATGREIHFPLFFAIPIILAAWNGSRVIALALAVAMPAARFALNFAWAGPWSITNAGVNEMINALGFLGLVALISRLALLHSALNRRVKSLEGVLPICSFCKRIRDRDERWIPLESYLASHSAAELTHGVCVDCANEHYPGVLAPKPGDAQP